MHNTEKDNQSSEISSFFKFAAGIGLIGTGSYLIYKSMYSKTSVPMQNYRNFFDTHEEDILKQGDKYLENQIKLNAAQLKFRNHALPELVKYYEKDLTSGKYDLYKEALSLRSLATKAEDFSPVLIGAGFIGDGILLLNNVLGIDDDISSILAFPVIAINLLGFAGFLGCES